MPALYNDCKTMSVSRALWGALAGAALLAAAPTPAAAQQGGNGATLPETVVTATRVATPPAQLASTVRVITAEEIERNQIRTAAEALRTLPGLAIARSGGPGKTTAIFSRGSNANHTLVLIDGIEINDPSNPDGRADLADLLADDIERIEVLYGAQGTVYGSDAIGAVVNIITKKGRGAPAVTVTAEGGSFKTFNQSAGLRGASGKVDYALSAQHVYVGGLSAGSGRLAPAGRKNDEDPYENYTLSGKLGVQATDRLSFGAVLRYADAKTDIDLGGYDADSRATSRHLAARADARLSLFDGRADHRFGIAYTKYDRDAKDAPDDDRPLDSLNSTSRSDRLKIDLQNDFRFIDNNIVTLGFETERESIDVAFQSTSAFGSFDQSAVADARNNAVYLQDQFAYIDRFFGTVGVRLDDHENFGTETTWRVAPAYLHRETGTKIKASYGTGFKAPSLFQLYGRSVSDFGAFVGNPDLRPERSRAWEAGLEQSLWQNRVTLSAVYFESEIKDLIQSNATFTTNVNIGRADTRGVEAFIRLRPAETLAATLNASYTIAKNADDETDLLRRPRRKASLDIGYRPIKGLTLSVAGIYIGRRPDIDAVTFARVTEKSTVLVNLAASYDVTAHIRAFGRIENLFDREYEDPNGFAQPGLGAFAGLTVRF